MPEKIRILIIDDEEVVCRSCERFLKEEGFHVETVYSGSDGIRMIDKNIYDIVMTDLRMPGISGMEILEHVKKSRPEIRVIMITGDNSPANIEASAGKGAAGYLPKPFAPAELLAVIRQVSEK